MAEETHRDFKSIDPNIRNADEFADSIGYVTWNQDMFDRRTTPWEKSCWNEEDLENFNIELNKIDRLYYIHHPEDSGGQEFEMVARMEYNGRKVYIELLASCNFTGFDCQGGGIIFVSSDANLFMKSILTDKLQRDLIYKSLAEDGIHTEEVIKSDHTAFCNEEK